MSPFANRDINWDHFSHVIAAFFIATDTMSVGEKWITDMYLEPAVEVWSRFNNSEKKIISLIIPFKIVEIPEMVMSIRPWITLTKMGKKEYSQL